MEEVDENEGYDSEDEEGEEMEEFKGNVAKPARIINFLANDNIQPFSLSSVKEVKTTQEERKRPVAAVATQIESSNDAPAFWLGKSSKASSQQDAAADLAMSKKANKRRYVY